jgi:hypothetical protein
VPSTAGRRARPPSSRRRGLQSRRNTASSSTPRARTRTRARARMRVPTRTRAGISYPPPSASTSRLSTLRSRRARHAPRRAPRCGCSTRRSRPRGTPLRAEMMLYIASRRDLLRTAGTFAIGSCPTASRTRARSPADRSHLMMGLSAVTCSKALPQEHRAPPSGTLRPALRRLNVRSRGQTRRLQRVVAAAGRRRGAARPKAAVGIPM